jgi:hypothetical protein
MHCFTVFPFLLKYLTNTEYRNSSWAVASKSTLMIPNNCRFLTFQVRNLMFFFHCLVSTKVSVQVRGFLFECFVTNHSKELLAPCPVSKLEDLPLSALRDYLFNIFTATLSIGGRSYILTLRPRHAVVTGTHLIRTHLIIQL